MHGFQICVSSGMREIESEQHDRTCQRALSATNTSSSLHPSAPRGNCIAASFEQADPISGIAGLSALFETTSYINDQ